MYRALENRSPGLFILKWRGLSRSFEVCSAGVKKPKTKPQCFPSIMREGTRTGTVRACGNSGAERSRLACLVQDVRFI